MHLSPYYFYLSLNIVCRVNFDMSVKLSSITTAATKFNFGKSNLYDFIFIIFQVLSFHYFLHLISSSPLGFSFYSFTHEFSANNSVITLLLMISESWRNVIVTFLNAWIWILKCDTSIFHILKLFIMVKIQKWCFRWNKKLVGYQN